MFGLVYPLAHGHSLGWPGWLFGLLAASILVLAVFAVYQVRRQRSGRAPLVEPSIFRHRPYSAGIVFSIVFVGSLGGIVMIFNVFLQSGLGFTPWHSALTTAPWAARHRRDRRHLLRPGRQPRRSRARLPARRRVDRARDRRPAGLLVRGGVRAAEAGTGDGARGVGRTE
jgi:hypothetical protein